MTTPVLQLVRARLVAASSVTALLGERITANESPQGEAAPYAVLQTISRVPESQLRGAATLSNSRVQVDVYAESYLEADAAAAAIRAVLEQLAEPGLSVVWLGERDLFEAEATAKHRKSTDYAVWVRASS